MSIRTTIQIAIIILIAMALPFASALAEYHDKPVIMIVHGAWGGGWAFRDTEKALRKLGFDVRRPTLTGLGERAHLIGENVGLTTHIQDVINVLRYEDLHDVVLVGHSYSGMVVTGVADREAHRIRRLVYLDAYVPENGESWRDLARARAHQLDAMIDGDGLVPPWVANDHPFPRDVSHPLLAYRESLTLKHPVGAGIPASYILTVEDERHPDKDEFAEFARRALGKGWPVHQLKSDHNPQWSAVEPLARLIADIAVQ